MQLIARVAGRDIDLEGQHVAAGQQVLLCLPAANRDPDRYPDPDRYDITRRATHPLDTAVPACRASLLLSRR